MGKVEWGKWNAEFGMGNAETRGQGTEVRGQKTEDRRQRNEIGSQTPGTSNQRPGTSNQQPATSSQKPATSDYSPFKNLLIEIRANSGYKPNIPVLQHSITPLYGLGDTCCLIVALKELTHLFEVRDHHGHTRA